MCNEILKKLIIGFKKGDTQSFLLIYKVFKRLIRLYAARVDYEETLSELNLFLIELLHKLDLTRFSSDYSYTIQKYIAVSIRNRYLDLLKKQIERIQKTLPLFEISGAKEDCYDEKIMLPDAFKVLTPKQKMVLMGKYIYGYNDVEISKMMGTTRQAVNSIKNRAFEVLRAYYNQ
ncbi:MAG: sigma-70 family RNA polymerase sigma factor [Clostridia bacterium]|nr:sigma-70 family RNA polymerase sigma factor [Clostridia bacterium]